MVPNEHFVIAGDVNIHVETSDQYAKRFHELLDLYNVRQHIDKPTHSEGHTLDVVLTPNKKDYLDEITVTSLDLSDHSLVNFVANVEKRVPSTGVTSDGFETFAFFVIR